MRKYTHRKKIDIPIYPGTFEIILTNNCNTLEEGYLGLQSTSYDDDGFILITVYFNLEAKTFSNGIISHECLHATISLFNFIQLQLSTDEDNGNEAYTYMLSWFVNEVYKFIKEKNITCI